MSGLSHKSHGELNQITANIMLTESIDPRKKAIQAGASRLANYARGTLSPIIKKNLKLDPNQGLAKGLLKKGTETVVDIGSKFVRDVGGGIKSTGADLYKLGRGIASNRYVKGAAVVGAGILDLARPKGKSFLRGLVNSDEKTQKEEVEILSEETITEASELLYISICGYLLESQLADDVDKAHAIMENMSDTWAEEIIQNVLLAEDE
jgi:hypothetical protein